MKAFKFSMLIALFMFLPFYAAAQETIQTDQVIELPDIGPEIAMVELNSTSYNSQFEQVAEAPEVEIKPGVKEFLDVSWKLLLTIIVTTLLLSANHITASTFSLSIWWHDNLKPAATTLAIALLLLALDMFVKSIDTIIETVFSISTNYNDHTTIAAAAVIMLPIIKGWFEKSETKAKVAAKKAY